MTYIDLINQFWELDEHWQFTCCETRLYFYFLKTANRLGWVDNWIRSDARVAADVGVSPNSLKTARNKLSQAGLISFTSGGKGKANKTRYQLSYQNLIPKVTPKEIPKVQPNPQPKVPPSTYNVRVLDKDKEEDNTLSIRTDEPVYFPPDRIFDKQLDECYQELKSNQSWIEPLCMNTRMCFKDFTLESFEEYLLSFFRKLQNEGETTISPSEAMRYFSRWLNVELKKQQDDRARKKTFESTSKPTAGNVRGKVEKATDIPSGTNSQKDYSSRF